MSETTNCPVCTTSLSDSETKCPTCGFEKPTVVFTDKEGADKWFEDNVLPYRQQWETERKKSATLCKKCNKELQADWKSCPYCSTPVDTVAQVKVDAATSSSQTTPPPKPRATASANTTSKNAVFKRMDILALVIGGIALGITGAMRLMGITGIPIGIAFGAAGLMLGMTVGGKIGNTGLGTAGGIAGGIGLGIAAGICFGINGGINIEILGNTVFGIAIGIAGCITGCIGGGALGGRNFSIALGIVAGMAGLMSSGIFGWIIGLIVLVTLGGIAGGILAGKRNFSIALGITGGICLGILVGALVLEGGIYKSDTSLLDRIKENIILGIMGPISGGILGILVFSDQESLGNRIFGIFMLACCGIFPLYVPSAIGCSMAVLIAILLLTFLENHFSWVILVGVLCALPELFLAFSSATWVIITSGIFWIVTGLSSVIGGIAWARQAR